MDAGSPQSSWLTGLEALWHRVLTSRLLLPAVLLIAFAVYAPTLNDWFSGDDFWFLRSSQTNSVAEYTRKAFDFRQTGSLPEFDR